MRQLKTGAVVLGLFLGGAVVGQVVAPMMLDQIKATKFAQVDSGKLADDIVSNYSRKWRETYTTDQEAKLSNETTIQLLYIQSRQNAQIIQLLKDIKAKK